MVALYVVTVLVVNGMLVLMSHEAQGAWDDEISVELAWDNAPFERIETLVVYQGELYAGGKNGQDKIYKSADGETWDEAFDTTTSFQWWSSVVFKDSLYFGSTEDNGGTWSAIIWRSTDGETLHKVYEEEGPVEIMPVRFGIFDDTLFLGLNGNTARILRSTNGVDWNEAYSTLDYNGFFDFTEYDGAVYATAGAEENGGAVFRSSNGDDWEKVVAWDDGTERWSDSARGVIVLNNELYVGVNGDEETTWARVFRSSDGEQFNEIWNSTKEYTFSIDLSVYRDRLYLSMSGDEYESVGGEIRVLDKGDFKLLTAGDGDYEHHFRGHTLFNDALYIAGGSGVGGSTDGFVYRITAKEKPSAIIDSISPNPGTEGETIHIEGHADNSESVIAYRWHSDIDDELATTATFSKLLSPGLHTISFSVQDENETWSEPVTRKLWVNDIPEASILSGYPNLVHEGDEVTVEGSGEDLGSIHRYRWESDIDGTIGNESIVTVSNLSAGTHTISFRVMDNDTAWSEPTSIEIQINALPLARAGENMQSLPFVEVQFDGQGTDPDGDVVYYEWDFEGNGSYDWASAEHGHATFVFNSTGTYAAVLRVTDNDGAQSIDVVLVSIELTNNGGTNESNNGGGDLLIFISPPVLISIGIVVALVMFFIGGTDLGRYYFFLFILPLYTRLKTKDIEDHETRALILGYILGNPGAHYSQIKKELGLKNGTFDHHIRILLKERKVKRRAHGVKVRFFPFSFTVGEMSQYVDITNKEQAYLLYLKQEQLGTVKEIAEFFSVTKQSVYPVIKSLKEKELIFYKTAKLISKQSIVLTDKGRELVEQSILKRANHNGEQ